MKVLLRFAPPFLAALARAGSGREWDTTRPAEVRTGVHDMTGCTGPHSGLRWGGTEITVDALVVDFDEAGIVCDHPYAKQ